MKAENRCGSGLILIAVLLLTVSGLAAQTQVKPSRWNMYSVDQDVRLGQASAEQIEKQLPILNDSYVQRYVSDIGRRLVDVVQGPEYPYQFKVVNVSDINAFALPGGFMYVNRGLIEAARSEDELAGVMAHEIAHVALRHGTSQVSKAQAASTGLGILGAILGDRGGASRDIVQAAGGLGLNATFLKFSRDAEKQADIVGAQTLHKAGYDPQAMATFFELLREKRGRDTSGVENFFSTHPAPERRAERIEEEVRLLGPQRQRRAVGDFDRLQRHLDRMGKAPSMADLQRDPNAGRDTAGGGGSRDEGVVADEADIDRIEAPARRLRTFRQRDELYRIEYPENWRSASGDGYAAVLAPRGGLVRTRQSVDTVYGLMIDRFEPSGRRPSLARASDQLLDQLLEGANSYLRVRGGWRETDIDGRTALVRTLRGRSPVTREDERVTLFTRFLDDGSLIHLIFVVPDDRYREARDTFEKMLDSLRIE